MGVQFQCTLKHFCVVKQWYYCFRQSFTPSDLIFVISISVIYSVFTVYFVTAIQYSVGLSIIYWNLSVINKSQVHYISFPFSNIMYFQFSVKYFVISFCNSNILWHSGCWNVLILVLLASLLYFNSLLWTFFSFWFSLYFNFSILRLQFQDVLQLLFHLKCNTFSTTYFVFVTLLFSSLLYSSSSPSFPNQPFEVLMHIHIWQMERRTDLHNGSFFPCALMYNNPQEKHFPFKRNKLKRRIRDSMFWNWTRLFFRFINTEQEADEDEKEVKEREEKEQ